MQYQRIHLLSIHGKYVFSFCFHILLICQPYLKEELARKDESVRMLNSLADVYCVLIDQLDGDEPLEAACEQVEIIIYVRTLVDVLCLDRSAGWRQTSGGCV